jgi:hypothetical protein
MVPSLSTSGWPVFWWCATACALPLLQISRIRDRDQRGGGGQDGPNRESLCANAAHQQPPRAASST